jgi:hypothetical protein
MVLIVAFGAEIGWLMAACPRAISLTSGGSNQPNRPAINTDGA